MHLYHPLCESAQWHRISTGNFHLRTHSFEISEHRRFPICRTIAWPVWLAEVGVLQIFSSNNRQIINSISHNNRLSWMSVISNRLLHYNIQLLQDIKTQYNIMPMITFYANRTKQNRLFAVFCQFSWHGQKLAPTSENKTQSATPGNLQSGIN